MVANNRREKPRSDDLVGFHNLPKRIAERLVFECWSQRSAPPRPVPAHETAPTLVKRTICRRATASIRARCALKISPDRPTACPDRRGWLWRLTMATSSPKISGSRVALRPYRQALGRLLMAPGQTTKRSLASWPYRRSPAMSSSWRQALHLLWLLPCCARPSVAVSLPEDALRSEPKARNILGHVSMCALQT